MIPDVKNKYARIISSLGQIPTLPSVVTKTMEVINSPNSSAEDAARFIEKDVALTSKVLRLANSAFYGIPRTISSATSAIVILGFNTIRSLVLSASVLKLFPAKAGTVEFDRKAFWQHSMMTAIATRMLAKRYQRNKLVDLEMAFSAGLLHDVGKIILEQFAHEDYMPALTLARKENIPLLDAEKRVLGLTHADVSGMLIERWDMPNELRMPVLHHHSPSEAADFADLAALVHYANHLAHIKGSSCIEGEAFTPLDPNVLNILQLADTEESLLAELEAQIAAASVFFALADEK